MSEDRLLSALDKSEPVKIIREIVMKTKYLEISILYLIWKNIIMNLKNLLVLLIIVLLYSI